MTREIIWRGMDVLLIGEFSSSRPAPRVSDHDGVGFSDDGTPAEVDIHTAFFIGHEGQRVLITGDMLEALRDDRETIIEMLGL